MKSIKFFLTCLLTQYLFLFPVVAQNFWQRTGLNVPDVATLFFTTNGDLYANGIDPGLDDFYGIFRSSDQGASWTLLAPPVPGAEAWFILAVDAEDRLYAWAPGGLFRSADGAQTWELLGLNQVVLGLGFSAQGDLLAVVYTPATEEFAVLRSSDDGQSWQQTNLPPPSYLFPPSSSRFARTRTGEILAVIDGGVYRSTDHGLTWTPILNLQTLVTAVAVNSRDDIFVGTFRVRAGTGQYTGGRLYRSTDGGQTWEQLPLPPATITSILLTPADHLYVAAEQDPLAETAGGVFFSADDGATWTKRTDGLTVEDVYALALSPDGFLFAGTKGGGLFRSVQQVTAVEPSTVEVPGALSLLQNDPNPFTSRTTLRFVLPTAGHVSLKIYNSLGQEVASLIDAWLPAGNHQVQWTPVRTLAAGVYIARLQTAKTLRLHPLVLLR